MRIGLALSGGGARGMAHVGVLSVLEQAGIPIHCVSGCSAGAILGAVYCAGLPIEIIRSWSQYMAWRRLARLSKSSQGFLSFDKMERWLVMMIGDLDFSDLPLPLAVVTMDAQSGERVTLQEGRLAPAVRASCSIPGVAAPVEINGQSLVDGGVVDNLPVDAARELGADYVIGVDVFEPHYGRERGPVGYGLTAIETLIRNSGGGVRGADFIIAPKTAGRTYIRFSKYRELIALGEEAAAGSLPALLADLDEYRARGVWRE